MEPVSLVVAELSAGAASGLSGVATRLAAAVGDGKGRRNAFD
ncbi:MAG: hypothetical protein ACRDTH_17455 [Pseudonocardiaceae bacterium]